MEITNDMIQYAASLAKLSLTAEQEEKAKEDLGKILGYIDRMNELDTDEIEPMSHTIPLKNVYREDVSEGEPEEETERNAAEVRTNAAAASDAVPEEDGDGFELRERLLENAPVKKDGCFVVPKTVE